MPNVNISDYRPLEHNVDAIFPERWSPRAMTGKPVAEQDLMSLFEAARWAPSSYNNQSWRFLYAVKDSPEWPLFFSLLGDFNQQWCVNAGTLVVIVSKATFDHNGKPSRTHSYDTGASWGYFALQGSMKGLVIHGMQGFDYDRARKELGVPEGYQVEAMAAVGHPADLSVLPEPMRKTEYPKRHKPLPEIAWNGPFPAV